MSASLAVRRKLRKHHRSRGWLGIFKDSDLVGRVGLVPVGPPRFSLSREVPPAASATIDASRSRWVHTQRSVRV